MLKRLFVLCFILVAALYAEEYECAEGMLGYQVVIKGTINLAPKVSSKTYTNEKYCQQDLDNYLKGKKSREEYECAEGMLGYQVVIKGTKNLAPKVSSKTYRSAEYCEEDLKAYLSRHKRNSALHQHVWVASPPFFVDFRLN